MVYVRIYMRTDRQAEILLLLSMIYLIAVAPIQGWQYPKIAKTEKETLTSIELHVIWYLILFRSLNENSIKKYFQNYFQRECLICTYLNFKTW